MEQAVGYILGVSHRMVPRFVGNSSERYAMKIFAHFDTGHRGENLWSKSGAFALQALAKPKPFLGSAGTESVRGISSASS